MTRAGPGALNVAPLWRRAAAGLINAVALLVPTIAVTGAGGALYARWRRGQDREPKAFRPFRLSTRWRVGMAIAFVPLEIRGRNWRSPGWRVMGLRHVEVRTGGPVSARSALVQHAPRAVWIEMTSQLLEPWRRRDLERLEATFAEVKAARRAHPDDREAAQRAAAEIFKRDRAGVTAGCLARRAVVSPIDLPALWSPLNQTLPERLAGIVVVRD